MILHEKLAAYEADGMLPTDVPAHVRDNLAPAIALRPYQERAISRFAWQIGREHTEPAHLLFHMATGSGKTVIMAAAMLHLYTLGYRDFLFFVHLSQIVEKTRANFVDTTAAKHLFARPVMIDGREVPVRAVDNFDGADPNAINIAFTTIGGLHTRLNTPRENGLTLEDFKERRTVLISDEAHHINALTKKKPTETEASEERSWEGTVRNILRQHSDNVLIEFSATVDMAHEAIATKYADKLLMDYPLRAFRADGYSKDIELRRADVDVTGRMLHALIVSEHRRAVASDHLGADWKPVVLMKPRTIAESGENGAAFHRMVGALDATVLARVRDTALAAGDGLMVRAFDALAPGGDVAALGDVATTLRHEFAEVRTTNVNRPDDLDAQQIALNTLENAANPVRCIFAVDKLDEGWDVLNLFDIVRLSDKRGKNGKPDATTMKEAQLIGRGARYYPFADPDDATLPANRRKYDDDAGSPRRLLEQMHYHCLDDVAYIADIRKALEVTGAIEPGAREVELRVKDSFRKTDVFKHYSLFANVRRRIDGLQRANDVLTRREYVVTLPSAPTGRARETNPFAAEPATPAAPVEMGERDIVLRDLGFPILRRACDENGAFRLATLRAVLPRLEGIETFLTAGEHLGSIGVTVRGPRDRINLLAPSDALQVARTVLAGVADDIGDATSAHEGTQEFVARPIRDVLRDRTLKLPGEGERQLRWRQSAVEATRGVDLTVEDWHVYDDCYGTSEEKAFVAFVAGRKDAIRQAFDEFFLIRNDKAIKLYEFDGERATEPDYILLMRRKGSDRPLCRQVFIEPKGTHLLNDEHWKSEFLSGIRDDQPNGNALEAAEPHEIRGLPFFNDEAERRHAFTTAFDDMLNADA